VKRMILFIDGENEDNDLSFNISLYVIFLYLWFNIDVMLK
jgi:hypothetical protein